MADKDLLPQRLCGVAGAQSCIGGFSLCELEGALYVLPMTPISVNGCVIDPLLLSGFWRGAPIQKGRSFIQHYDAVFVEMAVWLRCCRKF